MRINWTADWDTAGVALGYSTHQRQLKQALLRAGVELSDRAKVAVHLVTPQVYQPLAGRINVLFCLAPNTRVLTADLSWKAVGDVTVGDELIGFDEQLGRHCCYRRSRVLGTSRLVGEAYRVTTTRGEVIASANHLWVVTVKNGASRVRRWARTDELNRDMALVKAFQPWARETSYDAGWMAGFLDGEGSVPSTSKHTNVNFTQKEGAVLDRACGILASYGFTINKTFNRHSNVWNVQIHNGVRALGMFRPVRLLPKADVLWTGTRTWNPYNDSQAAILNVERIGQRELIGTLTETNTLVADGFLSHNTMYEMHTIPRHWIAPVNRCDLLLVPCTQNKALFERYLDPGLAGGKVPEVVAVQEGVDTEVYTEIDRRFPEDRPFRFLWVGASNARKGYVHTIMAWGMWCELHPEWKGKTELYMKTTQVLSRERTLGYLNGEPVKKLLSKSRVVKIDNAIVDTRRLPFMPENGSYSMRQMYHEAHAFLFPSMGEGFGLTLAEAMATGLPVIYTPWSGPVDFCDPTTGYPLPYGWHKVKTSKLDDTGRIVGTEHESWSASPVIEAIVARMEEVYEDYGEALKRGRRAAARIREGFTWDINARKVMEVLRERFPREIEEEA